MPQILQQTAQSQQPGLLLERVWRLLTAVMTRPTYLELLVENGGALKQLLALCESSAMVAEQLARYPILLDELLDPCLLAKPTPLDQYRQELQQFMLRILPEDEEGQLEGLRQFKQIQQLRVAAADVSGKLPLMKVSDHLTRLAEVLIEAVANLAWQQLVGRHGLPRVGEYGIERGFAIIGYGKLGGLELGYGSDLDLVFVHDCQAQQPTQGPKAIDSGRFYLKLAQRILHIFTTRTSSGILYDVDMRLRPSGKSGLLVSSCHAYQSYQLNEAWVWEHQALVRARLVYGAEPFRQWFSDVRVQVLQQERDESKLRDEVRLMRQKMMEQSAPRGGFDLKRSHGGIIDIEFIAQYLVLRYTSPACEAMSRWSDTIRILDEAVLAGLLEQEQAKRLQGAYRKLRELIHRHTLDRLEPHLDDVSPERQWVIDAWQQLLGSGGVETKEPQQG